MRCSKCQANVDHETSYTFVLGKKVVIYCDSCYEAYLKEKRKKPVLKRAAKAL